MTTQMKKESTALPNNKFSTDHILLKFKQGKVLLKLFGAGGTEDYANYLEYMNSLEISLGDSSKLKSFAEAFNRPAFVATIFEHPHFAEAVLGREYDPNIDTPERLIALLAEKGVPYHGLLTLSQQNVQDSARIRYSRLVLLGLFPPQLPVLQKLIRGQITDDTQRTWLSWLSDRELEKLVGQPAAPANIEEEMPEELKTPFDDLPAVPPGFPAEPTNTTAGSILAAYVEIDTRTLPEEMQKHMETAEIVPLADQNGHDSSENSLLQARILLQLEKNEALYYKIEHLQSQRDNANAVVEELLRRNDQLEIQLARFRTTMHDLLVGVTNAQDNLGGLGVIIRMVLNSYRQQEEEEEEVIDTTDPNFVTEFKGFTGGSDDNEVTGTPV